jgi:hypothetical protein
MDRTRTTNDESLKFEFLLTLEGNIIVQRYFFVKDFNPKSKKSMDLYEEVKYICEEISEDLKIKTSDYLIDNQYFFMNNDNVEDPNEKDEQYFLLQIKHLDEVFIERIFPAHFYHPKVRYAVDIRPMLKRILTNLTDILSSTQLETTYQHYEL